ncbi:MAG: carboxymuconolactone decarboxylase family protein [Galbitalea sp.]
MSRVEELGDDEIDEAARDAFAGFARAGRKPIALYRVLANAPTLVGGFRGIGAAIRSGTQLDRALIELIILRIGQLTGSAYVWNHHRGPARGAGAPDEKVDHLANRLDHPQLYSAAEHAALDIADAVHDIAVTDDAFTRLREHFSPRQATEVIALASHYESLARIMQGLAIDLEPEYRSVD